MEIKNTINNIKVTVEYDMQEDLELATALKKLSETKPTTKPLTISTLPKSMPLVKLNGTQFANSLNLWSKL